jgi:ribonuclease HI
MPDPTASTDAQIMLFTDGACSGNPGPGGWGCILRHMRTGEEKELSGGAAETTNNQMELQAVISGLSALTRRTTVLVVTDSTYVAKGCMEWMVNWKKNGWNRREGKQLKPIKNEDHWRKLDELLSAHQVRFKVVKGHSGHAENERCDELAVAESMKYRNA